MSDYDAKSIQILDGISHVRHRPGMYIGSIGTKGLSHLVYELLRSEERRVGKECL